MIFLENLELEPERREIDTQILEALGVNPETLRKMGGEIHVEISSRWRSYLTEGLEKERREQLIKKYPPAGNCTNLIPPIMNPEISICLSKEANSQDFVFSQLQTQLGSSLSALGNVMSQMMEDSNKVAADKYLIQLADSAQMMCNVHNYISKHRRYSVKPYLKQEFAKSIENCPIDEFLFGKSLNDSVKATQALKKAEQELKKSSYKYHDSKPGPSGIQAAKNTRNEKQQHFLHRGLPYKKRKKEQENSRQRTYRRTQQGNRNINYKNR